jgi:hypothetical protein
MGKMKKASQGTYEVFDDGDKEFNLYYRLVDENGKIIWYHRYNQTLEPADYPEPEELEVIHKEIFINDHTNSS